MTLSLFFQLAKVWRKHLEARDAGIRIRSQSPPRAPRGSRAPRNVDIGIVESVSAYSDVMLIGYFVRLRSRRLFCRGAHRQRLSHGQRGLNTYSMAQSAKLHSLAKQEAAGYLRSMSAFRLRYVFRRC